jgi:D-alanyl-lipoteichoic acid acyltransferase DltB (MBOAT superfamily)
MLFNSVEFLVFFAAVYAAYAALGHRAQNRLLLAASYLFYGSWNPKLLGLIALSTAVDYVCALRIEAGRDAAARRRWMELSVATSLGILGTFKYFDFFTESLGALLGGLGIPVEPLRLDLILPVGISFYTFQSMSYTLDVYRGEIRAERDPVDFALYVAFFPQLVAGPIERAARLLPQVRGARAITWESWRNGCWWILLGLFQKVVVADNFAPVADAVFSRPGELGALATLTGIYAFAFQIYGDFAGYSNIARGLAALMGFELMVNFRMPYFALDPSDFWRRWHISLSSWLRDYLYIPLGGNRGSARETRANLMATMLLGGLWHGAAWNFVAWGGFHGGWLIAHRWLRPRLARIAPRTRLRRSLWTGLRMLACFHLVCVGWVMFRVAHLPDAFSLLGAACGLGPAGDVPAADLLLVWSFAAATLAPLLALDIQQERHQDLLVVKRWAPGWRLAVYAVLFAHLVFTGAATGDAFIYFQF